MMKSPRFALALICTLAACTVKTEKAVDTLAIDTSSSMTPANQTQTATQTAPTRTPSNQPAPPASRIPHPAVPPTDSPSPAQDMTVTEYGIGNIHAGMTIEEAAQANGGGIAPPRGGSSGCGYATLYKAPPGLAMMVENGKIARIEVRSGRTPTSFGARVGDSEARIKSLYAGRVVSTPHKYLPGGHYLTVTPTDGSANRIVFETDGKAVTEFRSGALPAVEYVERCG
jgi:hypothetical protein